MVGVWRNNNCHSAQTLPALVRFGVFEADLRAGELRRNGVKVRLQDLPFRMLALLLARPGEVITREEFRQALRPLLILSRG
jgi:DNA-binding response OmpR family regulator